MYQWRPFLTEQVFSLFPDWDLQETGGADWNICWPGITSFSSWFTLYNDMFTALYALFVSINNKFA